MSWEPITRVELDGLLAEEMPTLDAEAQRVYDRFRIEPEIVYRIFKRNPSEPVPSFAVARSGSTVVYYDDIEEEWGTAEIAPNGHVYEWGTWGDLLRQALRNFPVPEALRQVQ